MLHSTYLAAPGLLPVALLAVLLAIVVMALGGATPGHRGLDLRGRYDQLLANGRQAGKAGDSLLDQIRTKIDEQVTKRTAEQELLDAVLEGVEEGRTDLTTEENEKFALHRDAIRAIDTELEALTQRFDELEDEETRRTAADELAKRMGDTKPGTVRVGEEPLTYRKGGEHSYFADLVHARNEGGADPGAAERLAAHAAEMRANMDLSDGTGGELVPPAWLMNDYADVARAGRVTAELCRKETLPAGTDSINIPKIATGASVATQTIGQPVSNTGITTASTSAPVITKAGQQVFPMQLLDQSPMRVDQLVFADLMGALAVDVDTYVISAATHGILSRSGANDVTYTDASPTVAELYPKSADAIQQIHTGRFLPPQAWVMHPRRWAWHLASLDSNSRPLVVPSAQGPTNAFAGMGDVRSEGVVGTYHGLPVYLDANIPTNLGSGTNQDAIIGARFEDLILYEGSLRTRVLFETDADTLSVRLQVWEYLAFVSGRYPKAISRINGTGLVTPSF